MKRFLKDINEKYPLAQYIKFPVLTDYLTQGYINILKTNSFYNEDKIKFKILRKYGYNEIGTSSVEQFYDYLNQLIDENFSEYLMNLITICDTYSIQNLDTRDEVFTHTVINEGNELIVTNDTPGNKLNIENIKAGTSATNVEYSTDKEVEYKDVRNIESTSALNTTQSNIKAQVEVNDLVQKALNKFIENLSPAFSIVEGEYYECLY